MADSGNENVQIQGLEFVLKTVQEQADGIESVKHHLEELARSLQKMPDSVKKISGLAGSLSQLSAVKLEHLSNTVRGLQELSKVGDIKTRIPERFIDELGVLNVVSQSMKSETIERTGKALQSFNNVQLPNIPANFASQLHEISSASQNAQTENLRQLGYALQSLKDVKFQDDFSKSLSGIARVAEASSQINVGNLRNLISTLKNFQDLNFKFAPHGFVSALEDVVKAGNAVTNDTISSLYRLFSALKMYENFDVPNAGRFRVLSEALRNFSYFTAPVNFEQSVQEIVNGLKGFQTISGEEVKNISKLMNAFHNFPTTELSNFYNVLNSFGSASRDLTELSHVNLEPLKDFLYTVSGMHMVGDSVISPAFIESVKQLVEISKGIEVGDLTKLMQAVIDISKVAKKGNFQFPTGFLDFVKEIQTAVDIFSNVDDDALSSRWLFLRSLQDLGEVKHIHSIAKMFQGLSGIGNLSISEDFTVRLKEITEFVNGLSNEQIDKVKDYADALRYLAESQKMVRGKFGELPKKVEVPKVKTEEATSKFQEVFQALPAWAQVATTAVSGALKGIWWVFLKTGEVALDTAKHIFTLKNALSALKLVGEVATAPFKAVQALDKAIAGIPKRIQKFTSHIRKALKAVEKFRKSIQKTVKDVKKFVTAIGNKLFAPIEKFTKSFTRFFKSLQRIALYRLIRRGIQLITKGFQEGMENLYQYSLLIDGDFHKSMDNLATDALYVKNSLAAMVSPLINALAPAIDAITDKFVDLLNLVNQTFSALTGKEVYTAAKKYKIAWAEAESAVSDAGDTAKDTLDELKRYVLGFDELNILGDPNKDKNQNSKDKGNSEDDLTDYLAMFEERPVTSMISDFMKEIREKIANGNFYEVGKMIAEKLNEGIRAIPFAEWGEWIGEQINHAVDIAKGFLDFADFATLGSGVAKFLNQAFEKIEFHNLGAVLAGKIRLALDFAYGFVSEFHFKDFGKDLGQMVSGFLISIDFDRAVTTLQWGFEGILDTVWGFLEHLQSFAFGLKIRKALSLVEFEGISARLRRIGEELGRNFSDFLKGLGVDFDNNQNPFEHLGSWLGAQLTHVFYKIPYGKLGEILGKGIQNTVANLRNFWQNLDLSGHLGNESLGNGIAQFVNNAVANVDFYSVGMTVAEKLSTVFNGIASFLNRTNWKSVFESVTLAVTGFFENLHLDRIDFKRIIIPLTEALANVAKQVTDFLVDLLQNGDLPEIGSAIGKLLNSLLEDFSRVLSALNPEKGVEGATSFIESILNEIDPNTFSTVLNQIITGTLDLVVGLLKKADFKQIGATIGDCLNDLDIGHILGGFAQGFSGHLGGVFGFLGGLLFGNGTEEKETSLFAKSVKDSVGEYKKYIQDAMSETNATVSDSMGKTRRELSETERKWGWLGATIESLWKSCFPDLVVHADETQRSITTDMDSISASGSSLSEQWTLWQESFNENMDGMAQGASDTKVKLQEQWGLWQESFNETIDNLLAILEKIKSGIKNAGIFIKTQVKKSLNGCVGFVESFVNAWVTGFNDISDVINSFSIDIPQWVPILGGNSWSPNLPKFPTVSIPRFDGGGFPKSGDLFFANENGSPELVGRMGSQTAVANQDQIIQGIAQGVMMAMNSGSQNQLIRQAITILQAIAEKDTTVEVTTGQIDRAKNRRNLRNGVLSDV